MADNGYVKLYRKIKDNPLVCKNSEHLAVWIYLLLEATHTNYETMFEGKIVTLNPGQLITGRKAIAQFATTSDSSVQRILKSFENAHQIEQQTSNKNRLITILNWQEYQSGEQQTEQQLNNKRTTTEQQLNTNKNVKNVKKDKNVKNIEKENIKEKDSFEIPDYLVEPFDSFVEMRTKVKKYLTERAKVLIIKDLFKLSSDPDEQIKILNQSTVNSWSGVYPLKNQSTQKHQTIQERIMNL